MCEFVPPREYFKYQKCLILIKEFENPILRGCGVLMGTVDQASKF